MNKNRRVTIDILELAELFIRKLWIVILAMAVCGAGAFAYIYYTVQPTYQSSALFYVNNRAADISGLAGISQADVSTSRSLVDTYTVILKTRNTLNDVIDKAGLPYSYERLNSMISAYSVSGTEVFRVTVTDTDPVEAELIANTIAEVLPDKIAQIVDGSSAKIVDYAVIPGYKAGPDTKKYALYGMIAGLAVCLVVMILYLAFDYEIHNENYLITEYPEFPLLAVLPDFSEKRKGRYYSYVYKYRYKLRDYKYGTDYIKTDNTTATAKDPEGKNAGLQGIGTSLSFASKEAYNQLRTNLDFSLSDCDGCRVIGVTSAMRAEGKSTTAINLCYSLAQDGKKVILIEGDMRIPSIAEKLKTNVKTGLSDTIMNWKEGNDPTAHAVVFKIGAKGENFFEIIPAGKIPPNPSELLGSEKMRSIMEELRKRYDYIVIDLPPVLAVTDAIVVSHVVDGVIILVRQSHTERGALDEVMRQIRLSGTNLLGFVFSWASDNPSGYSKKYRYRYYHGYKQYYKYGYYSRHHHSHSGDGSNANAGNSGNGAGGVN